MPAKSTTTSRSTAKPGDKSRTAAKRPPASGSKTTAVKAVVAPVEPVDKAPVAPKKSLEQAKADAVALIDFDSEAPIKQAKTQNSAAPRLARIGQKPAAEIAPAAPPAAVVKAKVEKPVPKPRAVLDLISAPRPEPVVVVETPVVIDPPAMETPPGAIEQAAEADASDAGGEDADKIIHLKPPIIVKALAQEMGIKPFQLIADLMEMNIFANINQTIEPDVVARVCEKHGYRFEVERREKGAGVHKVEEVVVAPPPPVETPVDELQPRAPIITFMGHVDHGKTSLMDAVRKTRVAAGEAGGITQHVGAYAVEHNGSRYTFIDTPGHKAFTEMRARGAKVTDIVVLVVAADDGLMPQTIEAINHAKAAGVSILVAINKIDLASANIDKVKSGLQSEGLAPEDWGGETICVPVSATKGIGIDRLLEMLSLQAEILELKASPTENARATVIEAQMEAGRGPTASVIVGMGTLKAGAPFICGDHWGKVKAMLDDRGQQIKQAPPSTPVKVLGFSGLPSAGDELVVMESERAARALSEERLLAKRTEKLVAPRRATLENLFDHMADDQKKVLHVVLKSDVQGSLEAIVQSLGEIDSDKIDLDIIHRAVGPISESDVLLSSASDAVIVGFNVKVESAASAAAKREGVQIKLYSIIYELIDQVKEAMAGMLDPELRETVIGHASVRKVFDLSRGIVAGCMVTDGRILRNGRARLLRGRQPIYDGGVATLRRFQDDVKEVRSGLECGIRLGDYNDYEEGDVIECYQLDKVAQQL